MPKKALYLASLASGILTLVLLAATTNPNREESPDRLTATANMETPRAVHTATLLPDGSVLIAGGFAEGEEEAAFASLERYDAKSGRFIPAGRLQTGRQSHFAILLPEGQVLIGAGYDGAYLSSAELYDPATSTSLQTGSLQQARIAPRATMLANGRVLVTGGADANMQILASAELYDATTGQFSKAGAMITSRIGHTQTLLQDGRVLIVGGTAQRRSSEVLASAEIYNPATGTFEPTGALQVGRHKHAAVLLNDGRVLIVGGSDARDGRGRFDSAELYNPATGTFTLTGKLKDARFKHRAAAVLLSDGQVLVAGGAASVERYDAATGRFSRISDTFDTARFFSTVTGLPDGRALIVGGYDRDIRSTAKAWVYSSGAAKASR